MNETVDNSQPDEDRKELPPTKWRPGCLTYAVTVLLLVFIVGWAANWFWARSEKAALDAALDDIQERGEPVWFADLKPEMSPANQEGIRLFQSAAQAYATNVKNKPNVWSSFEQTHFDGTGTAGVGAIANYTAPDIANFRQMLATQSSTLERLQQTLDVGTVRWEHDFSTDMPYALLLEEVQTQRTFSKILCAQGIVAIVDGDSDATIKTIGDLFRLADLTREDPFLVSHLVRVAIASQAVKLTAGLLENHNLTSQQRQELDGLLQQAEDNYSLRGCYVAERAAMLTTVVALQESGDVSIFGDVTEAQGAGWWVYARLPALQYRDMAKAIVFSNRTIACVDETGPAATHALEEIEQEISALSETYLMTKLILPSTGAVRRSTMRFRQQMRGLRIALRVDQAFRETGQLPATLNDVIDDSMPEVLTGTLSNLPPVYRLTNSGFLIYGLGTNCKDDGGGGDKEESDALIELTYPPMAASAGQPAADDGGQ